MATRPPDATGQGTNGAVERVQGCSKNEISMFNLLETAEDRTGEVSQDFGAQVRPGTAKSAWHTAANSPQTGLGLAPGATRDGSSYSGFSDSFTRLSQVSGSLVDFKLSVAGSAPSVAGNMPYRVRQY